MLSNKKNVLENPSNTNYLLQNYFINSFILYIIVVYILRYQLFTNYNIIIFFTIFFKKSSEYCIYM